MMIPFKRLTIEQVQGYLHVADAGGYTLGVMANLSPEAKDELAGLGLYRQSQNQFDYQWHLDHITLGGYRPKWSNIDVRRGVKKLGLAGELEYERGGPR